MTTTIQISENLRDQLLDLKENSKTSYEDIIKKMLDSYLKEKKEEEELLKESYLIMAQDNIEMNKEFESVDINW